ncbi:MAG TPA: helix-turn-helix transcriptional regulator [Candidatus Omnitrophota bacterium]|nr:helix-turn-helix transcriptional regulator [Candidatus Omnitrophota bacterium]
MSGGFSATEMKNARKQKRITLVELADVMGVSQGYLVRLEKGEIAAIPEQIELIKSIIDEWPEDDEQLYHQYRHPF